MPIFSNQRGAGIDKILSGLTVACGAIDISSARPCRLHRDEFLTVAVLADDLIACREVHRQKRAGDAVERRRRHRCPQVFAYLHGKRCLAEGENLIGTQHRILPRIDNFCRRLHKFCSGREPAAFVELTVVRKVNLRHDSADFSTIQNGRAVVQMASEAHRDADNDSKREPFGVSGNRLHGLFRCLNQQILAEKVCTTISRHAQFRKHDKRDFFFFSPVNQFTNLRRILGRVGQAHYRNRRHSYKTIVLHLTIFHLAGSRRLNFLNPRET